jgi:sugar phosphate isomerase/epimerase
VRELCDRHNIKLSGLSSHTPLCKPEISVEYLKLAIRWAADAGAPVVNTDEGPKPTWTTKEMDYTLMTYTLTEAARVAERHGIKIGLEPHQQYSKSMEGLDSIYELVRSPAIGINYDTGNSYLAGTTDTYEWLTHVVDRLVHLHADISIKQSEAEHGKEPHLPDVPAVMGVRWKRMIEIAKGLIISSSVWNVNVLMQSTLRASNSCLGRLWE